jgi:hypothetical protein
MTDYTLTDDARKMLTEYIGEKICNDDSRYIVPCIDTSENCLHIARGGTYENCPNKSIRTFATGNDLLDLKDAIVRKGEWGDFEVYAFDKYQHTISEIPTSFTCWLLHPTRFSWLVKEWRKEDIGYEIK